MSHEIYDQINNTISNQKKKLYIVKSIYSIAIIGKHAVKRTKRFIFLHRLCLSSQTDDRRTIYLKYHN